MKQHLYTKNLSFGWLSPANHKDEFVEVTVYYGNYPQESLGVFFNIQNLNSGYSSAIPLEELKQLRPDLLSNSKFKKVLEVYAYSGYCQMRGTAAQIQALKDANLTEYSPSTEIEACLNNVGLLTDCGHLYNSKFLYRPLPGHIRSRVIELVVTEY